jgi:hypothetical protein
MLIHHLIVLLIRLDLQVCLILVCEAQPPQVVLGRRAGWRCHPKDEASAREVMSLDHPVASSIHPKKGRSAKESDDPRL